MFGLLKSLDPPYSMVSQVPEGNLPPLTLSITKLSKIAKGSLIHNLGMPVNSISGNLITLTKAVSQVLQLVMASAKQYSIV